MFELLATVAAIALLGLKIWYRKKPKTARQRLLDRIKDRKRERNKIRSDVTILSYRDNELLNRVESLLREKRNKDTSK